MALRFGISRRLPMARAAVDALTQQIYVAHVAGILLDEVDDDVARRGFLAVDVDRRVEVKAGVDGPGMGGGAGLGPPRLARS